MRASRRATVVTRGLTVVAVSLLALLWTAPAALAHFGIAGTSPVQGEVVTGPRGVITFALTEAGQPVGDGFELVDGSGRAMLADVRSPDGGVTWVVTPAQALTDGNYGVAWTLAAPDTHAMSGTLTFLVTGAPPALPTGAGANPSVSSDQPSPDLASALARPDDSMAQLVAGVGRYLGYVGALVAVGALAFAFTALVGTPADVGTVARLVRVAAAAVLLGALVQAVGLTMVLGGGSVAALTPGELLSSVGGTATGWAILAQAAGALVLVVLVVLVPAPVARRARSAAHHRTPQTSASTAARILVPAGTASADTNPTIPRHRATGTTAARVLVPTGGSMADTNHTFPRHRAAATAEARSPVPSLWTPAESHTIPFPRVALAVGSTAGDAPAGGPQGGPPAGDDNGDRVVRVSRGRSRPAVVLVASALLLGAFLLDGHTTTAGPRAITIAADFLHTLAAAVWVGGVVALAVLVVARFRQRRAPGLAAAAARFSVPAAVAVLVVGIAGTALAATILESPSQLVSTTWGVMLLAKVALVGLVGLIGLYNNRRVVPALDSGRDAGRWFRVTVLVEAGLLLAVAGLTVALVAAPL